MVNEISEGFCLFGLAWLFIFVLGFHPEVLSAYS